MKSCFTFVKTTIVGGVFFLLPFIVVMILLREALRYLAKILEPLVKLLPVQSLMGIGTPYLVAAVVLLGLGFLAGLAAKTALGRKLRGRMEDLILRRLPGYTLYKGIAEGTTSPRAHSINSVALAKTGEDRWQFCFIIERHANGVLTVFTPSAPTPTSGSLSFVSAAQIREVDVPIAEVVKCLMKIGEGSGALLKRALKQEPL